jgi:hypothetical protein
MGNCKYWQGDRLIAEWNSSTEPCPPEANPWPTPSERDKCPWTGYTCKRLDVSMSCGSMPTDYTLKRFKPPFFLLVSWPDLPKIVPGQQLSFLDPPRKERSKGWCAAYHCREGTAAAKALEYDLGNIDVRVFKVTKLPRKKWDLEPTMFCR